MTAQITHKLIVTYLDTNEVVATRYNFSAYKLQSPVHWDKYARAVLQLSADAIKSDQVKVEIVTVSEE